MLVAASYAHPYSLCNYHVMVATRERPVSDLEVALAARLRSEIALQRIVKTQLAEDIGVHRTHLSRVIHGRTHIDLDLLDSLADALGISVVELIRDARQTVKDGLRDQLDEKPRPERTTLVAERAAEM